MSIMILVLVGCKSITPLPKESYLEVFLMHSFNNDSINVRTEVSNNISKTVKTNPSIDQATSFFLKLTNRDSTIIIKDINRGYVDSIKYSAEYKYLYIYYDRPNFVFQPTDKPLIMQ